MRLPKYDVLLPTLFVGVVFPAAAGGWWRYFSGYADQIAHPAVQIQTSSPRVEQTQDMVLAVRVTRGASIRASERHVATTETATPMINISPAQDEVSPERTDIEDDPIN